MSVERVSAECTTDGTADDWVSAVRRSIGAMRANVGAEHSLRTLARSAWLSPFHFHRVFLKVTDSTPARFLAAWRMAEAKRMLAGSPASVTDICMHIGYSSLGTFTSQFTRTVGIPPGRFRRLVAEQGRRPVNDALREAAGTNVGDGPARLTVTVAGEPAGLPAVVGLFRCGIPQEPPRACAVVETPGIAAFPAPPDGMRHVLAAAFDESVTVADAVVAGDVAGCYVGSGEIPAAAATTAATVDVRLRARRATDPPIVLALPLLLPAVRPVPAGR
jgi:AraC-like DNA-binding protein